MTERARRPTLADVARLAGTSTAVVSYVLNDGPRAVAPQTKARVEGAIAQLGYRRNPLASALMAGRSNLVGLLVPDSSNAFFSELAREFEREGKARLTPGRIVGLALSDPPGFAVYSAVSLAVRSGRSAGWTRGR